MREKTSNPPLPPSEGDSPWQNTGKEVAGGETASPAGSPQEDNSLALQASGEAGSEAPPIQAQSTGEASFTIVPPSSEKGTADDATLSDTIASAKESQSPAAASPAPTETPSTFSERSDASPASSIPPPDSEPSQKPAMTAQSSELEEKVEFFSVETAKSDPDLEGTFEIDGITYVVQGKIDDDPEGFYDYFEVKPAGEDKVYWLWRPRRPDIAWRLRKEAALLGKVRSPFLPELIAYKDGDEPLLLTAPLPPVFSTAEMGMLSLDTFLGGLAQITQALEALHQAGWIHGAVRPNILRRGHTFILTGLSRAVQRGERAEESFYFEGFSAPESLRQPFDERIDVYGIGALLYWYLRKKPLASDGAPLMEPWEPGLLQVMTHLLGSSAHRWGTMSQVRRALIALRARWRPGWTYEVGSATTIGMEVSRTTNQDTCGYLQGMINAERGRQYWGLFVVADGMGGMEGGDIASFAAVEAFMEKARDIPALLASHQDPSDFLKAAMRAANAAVWDALQAEKLQGGTTALVVLLVGNLLWAFHVGDCRLYLLREGKLTCLTEDHSLAALLLKKSEGYADPESLRTHPERSQLLCSLGEKPILPDNYMDALREEKLPMALQAGDILLLATDGLWEPLSSTELQTLLSRPEPAPRLAQSLVQEAIRKHTSDNTTAIVIRVHETYQT